jgi:hypothetical protein
MKRIRKIKLVTQRYGYTILTSHPLPPVGGGLGMLKFTNL